MSGCALFQIATTLSMLGTQVQKVSVTFWPDAAADELPARGRGWRRGRRTPGGDELPEEEQPARQRGERGARERQPAVAVARLRRRWRDDFMVPPR